MPQIYWFHANGFGAGCYKPLHENLAESGYGVRALDFLGHGDSEVDLDFENWNDFRDQVLTFVQEFESPAQMQSREKKREQGRPLVLVGHSLGGASALMAAGQLQKQGYNVQAVILLDPTILSPVLAWLLPFFTNPLAPGARSRRRHFKNMQLVRRSFRLQPTFKAWHPACFDAYLASSFESAPEGYALKLDPEMEARIFERFQRGQWRQHRLYRGPLLILRPARESVCPPRSARKLTRSHPMSRFATVTGSHFFPFEFPEETVAEIQKFLKEVSDSEKPGMG